jgi:hypothetical protein
MIGRSRPRVVGSAVEVRVDLGLNPRVEVRSHKGVQSPYRGVYRRAVSKGFSRGHLERRIALVVGVVALAFALFATPAFARGKPGEPKPIPGGFSPTFDPVPSDPFIHVLPPSIPFEMSTIDDFNGVIGASEIQGTAHGSDGTVYTFDTDMRFMRGTYVDVAGNVKHGTFAFI